MALSTFTNGYAVRQQFASGNPVTDQTIQDYLASSAAAMGLAANNISRYESMYQPLENQLIAEANSYASPTRVKTDMGMADSGSAQAMEASRQNSLRDLQAYGIDPSSGRYAALDRADQARAGAAEAGAGQQQRLATEAIGRALRSEAIQIGERYPGQIVNALNTGQSGYAGATNASLGQQNTFAALMNARSNAIKAAAGAGAANKAPQNKGGGQRPGGGGGGAPSGGQIGPMYGGALGPNAFQTRSVGGQPGAADQSDAGANFDPNAAYNSPEGMFGIDPYSQNGANQGPTAQDYSSDPFAGWSGAEGVYKPSPPCYEPHSHPCFDQPWQRYTSGFNSDSGAFDQGGYGIGNMYDMGGYNDYYDTGGYNDYSGDSGYAEGGAIPDDGPTTGGFIPQSASPSNGQQTDDIDAKVNANEFIIPRDVALWKGQEFFQKLIAQSRKARVTAPAHGTPSNGPPGGAPRFASQPMG